MKYTKYLNIKTINEAPIPSDEYPRNNYLSDKNNAIKIKHIGKKYFDDILKDITSLNWRDISFINDSYKYTIKLPDSIINKIKALYDGTSPAYNDSIPGVSASDYAGILKSKTDNMFQQGTYSFYGTNMSDNYIYMKIDSNNRTHFPNYGIPDALKGTGLGKKLYRALIDQKPWVCSNSGANTGAQWAWASLTQPQYKPNGKRDKDFEIYTFVIPHGDYEIYAISTTRPVVEIIESGYYIINMCNNKEWLRTKELRKQHGIGIDEDFLDLCRKHKNNNNTAKLILQMFKAPTAASIARAERAERARLAAHDNVLSDRLMAYCGVKRTSQLSSDWEIGDYIVIKSYLLNQNYNELPIRKVTKKTGNVYTAHKAMDVNETEDNRTTNDKSLWVKALPPAINSNYPPGIMNVPADTPRQRATASRRATASTTDNTTASTKVRTITNMQTSLGFTNDASKIARYNFPIIVRRNILRTSNILYVPKQQYVANTDVADNHCIYGYLKNVSVIRNTKTNEHISNDNNINNNIFTTQYFDIYDRVPVDDKRVLSPGDLVFIKSHTKFFGYVATVIRIARTSRGDNYIYLSVPGATRNQLILTPNSIERLVPRTTTNESIETKTTFSSIFEKFLNKIRNENK